MFYFAEYMEVSTSSMLLVTIFLGGWQLPFLHRDGITLAFGGTEIWSQPLQHWFVTVLQVLTFFGKVLAMCWFQTFVRWSLPRFRYDQLMKLGWRVLLPASLANLFATGILWLAIDRAGPEMSSALQVVGDLTQALTAALITVGVVGAVVGFFTKRPHRRDIVGSTAKFAEAVGGVKEEPMQA
jgi:NADH-quinone oxidoreductase subunit H